MAFPYAYNVATNDTDWIHLTFAEAWTQQQRLQNLDGVRREHSLYGPQTTRLSWIYPPFHRFLIKPQSLLMPEVFPDDSEAADTSMTSTEAIDGDASFDSMGGHVISPWRDVFVMRGRREVDLVVTKKIIGGPQIPLLVVELKRDDLQTRDAVKQIMHYMHSVLIRCQNIDPNLSVYGLLILGRWSLRIVGRWEDDDVVNTFLDVDPDLGIPVYVETDSALVNGWLSEQAAQWMNY